MNVALLQRPRVSRFVAILLSVLLVSMVHATPRVQFRWNGGANRVGGNPVTHDMNGNINTNHNTFYSNNGVKKQGYAEEDALLVIVGERNNGELALFLVTDINKDHDGGNVGIYINMFTCDNNFQCSNPFGSSGAKITKYDDGGTKRHNTGGSCWSSTGSCVGYTNDCYSWDECSGQMEVYFKWVSCCVDGLILNPLPATQDFCMDFSFWQINLSFTLANIIRFVYKDDDGVNQVLDMDFATMGGGFSVCLRDEVDYCTRYDNCASCTADDICGWCGSSGCVQGTEEGPLNNATCDVEVEEYVFGCCESICEGRTTCGECNADGSCGWCADTETCLGISGGTPCNGTCSLFSTSPACVFPNASISLAETVLGSAASDYEAYSNSFSSGLCNGYSKYDHPDVNVAGQWQCQGVVIDQVKSTAAPISGIGTVGTYFLSDEGGLYGDHLYSADVKTGASYTTIGLMFHYIDEDNNFELEMSSSFTRVKKRQDGVVSEVYSSDLPFVANQFFTFEIQTIELYNSTGDNYGTQIDIYKDSEFLTSTFDGDEGRPKVGRVGFSSVGNEGAVFDNVIVRLFEFEAPIESSTTVNDRIGWTYFHIDANAIFGLQIVTINMTFADDVVFEDIKATFYVKLGSKPTTFDRDIVDFAYDQSDPNGGFTYATAGTPGDLYVGIITSEFVTLELTHVVPPVENITVGVSEAVSTFYTFHYLAFEVPASGYTNLVIEVDPNSQSESLVLYLGKNSLPTPTQNIDNTLVSGLQNGVFSMTINSPVQGDRYFIAFDLGSGISNVLGFDIIVRYPDPVITSISPGTGPTIGDGVTLVINGRNFGPESEGDASSICQNDTVSWSGDSISCTPLAGQGSRDVTIIGNGLSSNTLTYNYDPPSITTMTPTTGTTDGGYLLSLVGTSFGTTNVAVTVGSFGECDLDDPSASNNHTHIVCRMPPGGGNSVPITVSVDGQLSPFKVFAYDAPVVDAVDPSNGPTVGGFNVTVTGSNFGATAGITIGNKECVISFVNTTYIVCEAPLGEGSSRTVLVDYEDQLSNTNTKFAYDPPVIDTVTPGLASTEGTTEFVIVGSNFGPAPVLRVNDIIVTGTTVNQTHILGTFPAGSGTGRSVVVQTADQTSSLTPATIDYIAPSITDIDPTTGPTRGTGTLTINGFNFFTSGSVLIGTTTCSTITWSNRIITCRIPAGTGANKNVVVRVGGQDSAPETFSYTKPSISSITAVDGTFPTGDEKVITITGTNFGAVGSTTSITVGGSACAEITSQHTHETIRCRLPEGQGTVDTIVTVGGQASDPSSLTYDVPVITSLTPQQLSTQGGDQVILVGTNFGLTGTLTIDGLPCAPTGDQQYTHTTVECDLPENAGANLIVNLTVGGQTDDTSVTYTYGAPVIGSISDLAAETDYDTAPVITISGSNFGQDGDTRLFFGQDEIIGFTHTSHTEIEFDLPAGVGTGFEIRLETVGQNSTCSLPSCVFNYEPPVIAAVSGCTDDGTTTQDCPITGSTPITITGTSLGNDDSSVTIKGEECTGVFFSIVGGTHQLVCDLPAIPAGGFDVNVAVNASGQIVTAEAALSYSGPEIVTGSLRLCADGTGDGQLVDLDPAGGQSICFNVTNLNAATAGDISVFFGGDSFERVPEGYWFNCTSIVRNADTVQCDTDPAMGQNLVLYTVVGLQTSPQSVDSLTFATPVFINDTIRSADGAAGAPIVTISSSFGARIYFDVTNMPFDAYSYLWDLISIKYGIAGSTWEDMEYECGSITMTDSNTISCLTEKGDGRDLAFLMTALNTELNESHFLFNYPVSPIITAINGCTDDGTRTDNCPTDGGNRLTFTGSDFCNFRDTTCTATIEIGNEVCSDPQYNSVTEFECTLPANTGTALPVTMTTQDELEVYFSAPAFLLSYAEASITAVSGCTDDGTTTVDCPRTESVDITITGTNFGASGAAVLIGGSACASIAHDVTTPHEKVTCTAPAGTDLARAVILLQSSGDLSSNFGRISYLQCAPGTFDDVNTRECTNCTIGRFTNVEGATSCSPCEPGFYSDVPGLDECIRCDKGSFSEQIDNEGATECTPCAVGRFAESDGANECFSCDVGFYQPEEGATECLKCAAGNFTQSTASTECQRCDAGEFSSNEATVTCEVCSPGTFSPAESSTECTRCPKGRANNAPGVSECPECTPGFAANRLGLQECLTCDAGFFSNDTRLEECLECPAGSVTAPNLEAGATECSACLAGTYSPVPGQPVCLDCGRGSFTNTTGQATCTLCVPGFAQNNIGQQSCLPCDAGAYSPGFGSATCIDCPAGRSQSDTGQASCVQCPAGEYQDEEGEETCKECPAGRSNSASGQAACEQCSPGKISSKGAETCSSCGPGTFSSDGLTCQDCPLGRFASGSGTAECLQCPQGRFGNDTGLTICYACDPGTYADEVELQECTACDEGTYAPNFATISCLSCEAGRFANTTGALVCSECEPGKAQINGGQDSCDICGIGTYSAFFGQASCTPCEPGQFNNLTQQTECQSCSEGTFQADGGQDECDPCPLRRYGPTQGLADCPFCPAGFQGNQTGLVECFQCEAGYASPFGSDTCTICDKGKFSSAAGQSSCSECDPGSFAEENGSVTCSLCPNGRYSNTPASEECTPCDTGEAAPTTGSITCTPCLAGYFANSTGQPECYECPAGQYQVDPGASECLDCDPGTFSEEPSSVECSPCPQGQFNNETGAEQCYECDPGSYQDQTGQLGCIVCPLGRAIDVSGQKECSLCPRGQIANTTALETCLQCPVGKIAADQGLDECSECDAGRYNPSTGLSACIACAAGSFSEATGQDACTLCVAGEYADDTGLTTCDPCPEGEFSPTPGQDSCTLCDAGSFNNETGRDTCTDCPTGFYQGIDGQDACIQCPLGKAATSTSQTVCDDCEPGRFADDRGTESCSLCAPGREQPLVGQSFCTICPAGRFSLEGSPECSSCSERQVAPTAGLDSCEPCDVNADANPDGTKCLCDAGFYGVPTLDNKIRCFRCPKGARCDAPGVLNDTMETATGFWRADTTSLNFYQCLLQAHCSGGRDSSCGAFRTGPLCANCLDGYEAFGTECTICPEQQNSYVISTLLSIMIVCIVLGMYYVVLRSDKQLLRSLKRQQEATLDDFDDEYYAEADEVIDEATVAGAPPKHPSFLYKMKILLTFFQISVGVAFSIEAEWPNTYKEFIATFNVANFDLVQWSRVGCVTTMDYYDKHLITALTPIFLFLAIMSVYVLPKYIGMVRYRNVTALAHEYRARYNRGMRKFWKLFLFTLFLIFPVVSSIVVRLYDCVEVEGNTYLKADFTLFCYTDEWHQRALYNIPFVVLYPFGIPAFFTYLLVKNRKRLHLPEVKIELGFLFGAFDKGYWWFEVVDMIHKLLLTSVITFAPQGAQITVGLVILGLHMTVLMYVRPYARKGDDRLHLLVQTELILLVMAARVFESKGLLTEQQDKMISSLFIIMTLTVVAFCLFQVIKVILKLIEIRRKRKKRRKQGQHAIEEYRSAAEVMRRNMDPNMTFAKNPLFATAEDDSGFTMAHAPKKETQAAEEEKEEQRVREVMDLRSETQIRRRAESNVDMRQEFVPQTRKFTRQDNEDSISEESMSESRD